jgi:hypothetical protein
MHSDEIEPGLELVELAREIGEVDRSGGAVIELAGIGLGIGGEAPPPTSPARWG